MLSRCAYTDSSVMSPSVACCVSRAISLATAGPRLPASHSMPSAPLTVESTSSTTEANAGIIWYRSARLARDVQIRTQSNRRPEVHVLDLLRFRQVDMNEHAQAPIESSRNG